MKKLYWLIILWLMLLQLGFAEQSPSFVVVGIDGKARDNIQKRLLELQGVRPLQAFNQETLQAEIQQAIAPFGYFKSIITVKAHEGHPLLLNIHKGPLTYISSLTVSIEGDGANNPMLLYAIKTLPIQKGDPFLTIPYNKTKLHIANAAEHLGYLHGFFRQAEVMINENNTAVIRLTYDTGPLFYYGKVSFNTTTLSNDLLQRYVPFKPNHPYNTNQVLKLNKNLTNSGYFSSVLVKPKIGNNPLVPIDILLQSVPKYTYAIGAGYGTDTGIRGRYSLNVIPLNDKGHKFNVIAQGSMTQNALQAQYLIPTKNPVTDQYNITGNISNLNYNTGYSNANLFSIGHSHVEDFYKRALSLNALYESFHYSLDTNTYQFLLYPKAKFTWSKTTNPLFSPTGYNVTITALGASEAALSRISFLQTSLDAKGALWIESLRLRLYGHVIEGATAMHDISELPLSLALLLGGADNLKALSFNSVGPGRRLDYAGFEVQKEVVKNWYATLFYDVGAVYNPSPCIPRYDAGAAIMWVSPIGPIKIGLAQEINASFQRDSSNPRLIISMGPDL